MPSTATARVVALAGILLTLSACGGSGDEEAASTAIADSIMREQKGSNESIFAMKREEADCIGDGFVDSIGVDTLQEYGFLTDDLKAKPMTNVTMKTDDAEAATDVLFECADVNALMEEALASSGQVDEKTQACIDDVLTDDRLRSMFTLMFSGKEDQANQEVVAPLMECASGSSGQ